MRNSSRILLVSSVAVATALSPTIARAQIDINPPIPNVLLLLDTSGSMERMADGKTPEAEAATCVPGTATPLNRWATLVSVMTGTINNFSCSTLDRSSASFRSEYQLSGVDPYDYQYFLPFHRLLSNNCTPGPGATLPTWYGWPAGAIKYHSYSNPNIVCPAPGTPGGFSQANDGILDTFRDRVRFGLMTFDSFSDPGTGAVGAAPDQLGGKNGMWSYFPGWNTGGSPATGNPANCSLTTFEVGARNPAAPAWEGRLMPFGAFDAAPVDNLTQNDHIQEAILAMRPYGATPMAGMLNDARDFILNDTMTDPLTNKPFGPSTDPYFDGGCRKTFIIVLSDGTPNLDLRTQCATGNGKCPYQLPYEIAHDLATNADPNKRVLTYAVGFGLSNSGPTLCKNLTTTDLTQPGGICSPAANDTLAACCTLGRIAYEGGTTNAFYADDVGTLKTVLSQVLKTIASGSTSRTLPVFSSASSNAAAQGNASAASYQFASSFNAPAGASLWSGNLDRERYACQTVNGNLTAVPQPVQASLGDDFGANVNSNDAAHPRKFFTILGDPAQNGVVYSTRTLRPFLPSDDGLGTYKGVVSNGGPVNATTFSSSMGTFVQAMGIDPLTPPTACSSQLMTPTASVCAQRTMRWEVGLDNLPTVLDSRNPLSCPINQTCSMFGSIYHSTPFAVGTPNDFLRDESYSLFAVKQPPRPLVLYTATTDGQLHAFKVAPNDPNDGDKIDHIENNEIWSFFPPAVLPRILPTYNQQAFLLDGAPVVKDVVYERTQTQATAGGLGGATWSTVLLAGGGPGGPFYYALDVTDPYNPKFLWQIATDASNSALFGTETSTPAIATIPLLDQGVVKEVAVAILPGGSAAAQPGSCTRQQTQWPNVDTTGTFKARSAVRCWGPGGSAPVGPARSLTIARLDTGKILMNFRGALTDGPASLTSANSKVVLFDSPITGVPVPYPSQAGQVANRIYVGDSDGTLWRVDLTNPDPTKWLVSMAWDSYGVSDDTALAGQPIQTPPIVSLDAVGNNVILFSTGDQEQFNSAGNILTRVWSISDKPNGTTYQTSPNWYVPFTNGKRVTGPISLFNSIAYFATFTPTVAGGASCADGFGSIWGLDYLVNKGGYDKPQERLVPDPVNNPLVVVPSQDQAAGTVVFGVAVTQTPTCNNSASTTDPYLGNHTAVTNVSSGSFQLVFQTGKGGAQSSNGSLTNTTTVPLQSPRKSTRVDSWASVVE